MSTCVYTGLNPFNFIRKHFLQIRVRKVAVHFQKVFEGMSTSVYTGLNPFNFIRKHFRKTRVRKVAVNLEKVLEVMSTSICTGLNPYRTRSLSAQRLSERTVQDGHCTNNVTLTRARVTSYTVEKQRVLNIMSVCVCVFFQHATRIFSAPYCIINCGPCLILQHFFHTS
jgi:hypothetical protein